MRILTILNDSMSPPGLVWDRFKHHGADVVAKMPYQNIGLSRNARNKVPADHDEYDALLVLGGAMCADQDLDGEEAAQIHDYLPQQAKLIRTFDDAEKPVLGICLGSQLIARAFGGKLIRGGAPEFGFVDITYLDAARNDPLLGPETEGRTQDRIMEWHDDTFELPERAELLMSSEACPHQAFRIKDRNVWAFQFHPEVTRETVGNWAEVRARLTGQEREPFVKEMLAQADQELPRLVPFINGVIDRWLTMIK